MVQPSLNHQPAAAAVAFQELFLRAYRWMLLARVLDDKYASLYRGGKIYGGCFLGRGQEAFSVAAGLHLRPGDVFAPLVRDAAGRLAFGETLLDAVRTFLGSPLGPMRARDGNVHRGRLERGQLPMISHLGAMISVVNGVLLARRMKGVTGTVGVASLGDGGTSTGAFHEAMNQAGVERLPLVMLVANNQFAYSTPNQREFACEDLALRAPGYGITEHRVDGTDLAACLQTVGGAIAAAREGAGPQMVVARLLRMCGHGEHDDASYIGAELKQSPAGRDCLRFAEETLTSNGWADTTALETMRAEVVQQVEETLATVQREPPPDPYREEWAAISTGALLDTQAEPVMALERRGLLDLP